MRVLVVPPEVSELAALQSWVAEREVRLDTAASQADALSLLAAEPHDLVVCDGTGAGALDLLREARARGHAVPFVLLSPGSADDLAHRARTLGGAVCVPGFSLTAAGFAEAVVRALSAPASTRAQPPPGSELAPAMLWRTGPDGAFTKFTVAWCRYTGRAEAQELGSGWIAGLHPDDLDPWLEGFGAALGAERVFDLDVRVRDSEGDYRWLRFHGVPRLGPDQSFVGFLGASFEIGDLKRAETELAGEVARLRSTNADLEQFAGAAAHDLDEPLRTLENALERLDDADADSGAEPLDVVRASAGRMRALVRDLLACMLVGASDSAFEPVDLSTPLDWALENLESRIRSSQAQVTRDALPVVRWDPVQMARAFQNLIANALRFRSQEAPLVHVSAENGADLVIISVCDNGTGIDPEHHESIFEPFKRAHTREVPDADCEVESGSGLGLALCKRVAERHGGRIWVESEPGKGSTFYLSLRA